MSEYVLKAESLCKTYHVRGEEVPAVRGVSLHAIPGEIVGFLGPNGAGKTTTLRMLTTLLPIDRGTASIAGFDVGRQPHLVRPHIGYVSQRGGADDFATARENLHLQGRLYGQPVLQTRARTEELLEHLDLAAFADRVVSTYSGGQRRRLDIALGIMHHPEVLFLDEPSTGLDPQNRADLWNHIRRLRDQGTAVFLTTHYLDEADALSDRVMIIDHGTVAAEGTPQALKREVSGDRIDLSLASEDDAGTASELAQGLSDVHRVSRHGRALEVQADHGPSVLVTLLGVFAEHGIGIATVDLRQVSLDDVFLAYTGRSLRDAGEPAGSAGGTQP